VDEIEWRGGLGLAIAMPAIHEAVKPGINQFAVFKIKRTGALEARRAGRFFADDEDAIKIRKDSHPSARHYEGYHLATP